MQIYCLTPPAQSSLSACKLRAFQWQPQRNTKQEHFRRSEDFAVHKQTNKMQTWCRNVDFITESTFRNFHDARIVLPCNRQCRNFKRFVLCKWLLSHCMHTQPTNDKVLLAMIIWKWNMKDEKHVIQSHAMQAELKFCCMFNFINAINNKIQQLNLLWRLS